MNWVVEVQTASYDDEIREDLVSRLTACRNYLGPHRSTGSSDDEGWDLRILVDAADLAEAWRLAMSSIFEAAAASGLPFWPVVAVSVMDAEYAAAMGGWFESP